MSTEPGKPGALPTIRTFAADLDRVRHAREESKQLPKEKEPPITSTPKNETPKPKKPRRERRERKKSKRKQRPTPLAKPAVAEKEPVPIPVAEPVAKEVGTIPPFHTIDAHKPASKSSDEAPHIDTSEIEATQRRNAKPSVLESVSTRDIDISEEDESVGTIVSDVKRKRFRFFPALFRSIRESFIELGTIVTGKDQQTYSIQKTERRKGVIQTATSKTGRFATSDHDQVMRRLRSKKKKLRTVVKKRTRDSLKKPKRIIDPAHLLEAPEPEAAKSVAMPTTPRDHERKIVSVRIEPRKRQPMPQAVVPELTSVVPDKPTPTPPPAPRVVEKPIVPPEPTPVEDELEVDTVPEPEVVTAPEPTSETAAAESSEETPAKRWSLSGLFNNQIAIDEEREGITTREEALTEEDINVDYIEETEEERPLSETSLLAIGITVALILLAGSFIFFREMIVNVLDTRNETVVIVPEPVIDGAPVQIAPIEIPSLATILVRTNEIAASTNDTIVIRPAYQSAGVQTPLTPIQFIELLGVDVDAAFMSAFDEFALGATEDDTLFLAFTIRNAADVYGGMLSWEQTLLRDTEQLFGTYSAPTSTRANQLSPFVDIELSNTDARVAHGQSGAHVIYGIIDDHTLIVTGNEQAYETLVSLVRGRTSE